MNTTVEQLHAGSDAPSGATAEAAGMLALTTEEIGLMLDIVAQMRPLGRQRWEEVAQAYNAQVASWEGSTAAPVKDAETLKRRFMLVAYEKQPSEWSKFTKRAVALHHSILEEAGASPSNLGSITLSAGHGHHGNGLLAGDGMLLLTEGEVELVNSASASIQGFDVDFLHRISSNDHLEAALPPSSNKAAKAPAAGSKAAAAAAAAKAAITLPSPIVSTSGGMLTPMVIPPMPVRTGKRGRPAGSTTGSAAKRMAQQAEQVALLTRTLIEVQQQIAEMHSHILTLVDTQSNQSSVIAALQERLAERTAAAKGASKENQSETYKQLLA